ncbi:lymphatic vessel endothelial hyaluronic receptor 1b isoform 2-T2 [Spinachia spinachia]
MAGLSFRLLCFAASLLASPSHPTKDTRSHSAAGVFMIIEGGEYTFNSSAAAAACRLLNVTIATRAQVERAQRRGLETCKFGWIAEQIAVVLRHTADKKCGQGFTGVVTWRAKLDQRFGVFCFDASDFIETPSSSTAGAQSSPPSPTVAPRPGPSGPSLTPATRTPPSMAPTSTNAAQQTATPPPIETTRSSPKPSSTHIPTSLSQLRSSKPSAIALTLLTFSFSLSAQSATPRPTSSATASSGNVATALITLGGIIIIIVVVVAVLLGRYHKLNALAFWPRGGAPRDDTETEMWKHDDGEDDGEDDPYRGHEGGDEESDGKYCSDITLCVNPDTSQ